jgi:hypothetical protein
VALWRDWGKTQQPTMIKWPDKQIERTNEQTNEWNDWTNTGDWTNEQTHDEWAYKRMSG